MFNRFIDSYYQTVENVISDSVIQGFSLGAWFYLLFLRATYDFIVVKLLQLQITAL